VKPTRAALLLLLPALALVGSCAANPVTGRQHQLRAHMELIGHPIVGDNKYDGQDALADSGIEPKLHLHARRLIIPHPAGRAKIDVTAPLPEHMLRTWDLLGFDPRRFDKDDG